MNRVIGYLRLMRPANIVTAVADILAGIAIAGTLYFSRFDTDAIVLLCISTSFLYGGGVVMNDVFDAELDKIERPERPIPSGLIRKSSATIFGVLLLVIGIVFAAVADLNQQRFPVSLIIAALIAIFAVTYDKWMKHHSFFGPLNMGVCRGLNLLLGMSIYTPVVTHFWFLALVPVVYIFAITMISRGEVHGGKRTTLYIAALLYAIVVLAILAVSFNEGTLLKSVPFVAFFVIMIFVPLQRAIKSPIGPNIGKAVKSGVISLIIMNASWAAAVDNLMLAFVIIFLLPVSLFLARMFAVT